MTWVLSFYAVAAFVAATAFGLAIVFLGSFLSSRKEGD